MPKGLGGVVLVSQTLAVKPRGVCAILEQMLHEKIGGNVFWEIKEGEVDTHDTLHLSF